MAYNTTFAPNGGMAFTGYGSRGKATGLKRLSVAAQPKVAPINENEVDNGPLPTPRTSRSHLLAGLRTAPRTPSVPASAPYNQTQHPMLAKYAAPTSMNLNNGVPHTAIGSTFPSHQLALNPGQQFYALPEQVLAPPPLEIDEHDQLDPSYLAQLAAAEQCLNQRAQMLQQQLASLQLASARQQSFQQAPMTPQASLYQQQLLSGLAPVPQQIQPGVYLVFNPLTGQYTYAVDPNAAVSTPVNEHGHDLNGLLPQLANSPPPPTPTVDSPLRRTMSPARHVSPPREQSRTPLSAADFRRGHTKNVSSLKLQNMPTGLMDGPKSALPRLSGIPSTPMTGTFGPGQGRAGEHPTRQPRGPPSIEELKAKPTTKHEGSKNFATRTRRKALSSLVRAGLERRVQRPASGTGSQGSMTPVSESEMTFSVPSDNDSDSGRSLSGRLSIGSLRAVASGAIGSERRRSQESSASTTPSNEPAEIVRKKTPLLGLIGRAEGRRIGAF